MHRKSPCPGKRQRVRGSIDGSWEASTGPQGGSTASPSQVQFHRQGRRSGRSRRRPASRASPSQVQLHRQVVQRQPPRRRQADRGPVADRRSPGFPAANHVVDRVAKVRVSRRRRGDVQTLRRPQPQPDRLQAGPGPERGARRLPGRGRPAPPESCTPPTPARSTTGGRRGSCGRRCPAPGRKHRSSRRGCGGTRSPAGRSWTPRSGRTPRRRSVRRRPSTRRGSGPTTAEGFCPASTLRKRRAPFSTERP